MSGNWEKTFQQRQERRPSLSFHSCPVILSSSLTHMSSPTSHGNSISTKEREPRFNSFFQEEPVCKKQCCKGNQTKRTFEVIKTSRSIANIHQTIHTPIHIRQQESIKYKVYEEYGDKQKSLLKKRSKSFPTLNKECSNKWNCIPHLSFDVFTLNDKALTSNTAFVEERHKEDNCLSLPLKEKLSRRKDVNASLTKLEPPTEKIVLQGPPSNYPSNDEVLGQRLNNSSVNDTCERRKGNLKQSCSIKTNSIYETPDNVESKVFFPNSLLLFPFPTTPVEKCFSPKTPCPSPLNWNSAADKTEPLPAESKKSRGAKFEFGASFLRRFSLTQITS